MDIIDYGRQYIGFQETAGSNRGPLVDKWKREVSAPLETKPIPWCGVFAFAMLMESTGMTRKQLATALGFDVAKWYPESADSWLAQGKAAGRITVTPKRGDIFLLMAKNLNGEYSDTDAHHVGFCAEDVGLYEGRAFATLEGNTVPGNGNGHASREGTSVAARSRIFHTGTFVFLSIPAALKTVGPATLQALAAAHSKQNSSASATSSKA